MTPMSDPGEVSSQEESSVICELQCLVLVDNDVVDGVKQERKRRLRRLRKEKNK